MAGAHGLKPELQRILYHSVVGMNLRAEADPEAKCIIPEGMSGREPRKKPERGETFPPLRGSRSEAKLRRMEKQEKQFAKS